MIKEYSGIRIAGLCTGTGNWNEKAADVAAALAEELLLNHRIMKEEIKILVYVTQTPLFMTPSTSFYIAKKLQIGQDCFQYDINQGATGMLTGIQLVASLMLSMEEAHKGLLLIAEDDLERQDHKQPIAAALLLEKEGDQDNTLYVKNTALGRCFPLYYKGYEDAMEYQDECFLSLGKEILEKQKKEMAEYCSKNGVCLEHTICIPEYDSAVRLPMYIVKEQIKGYSMLAALGAGMSAATLVCNLGEELYK